MESKIANSETVNELNRDKDKFLITDIEPGTPLCEYLAEDLNQFRTKIKNFTHKDQIKVVEIRNNTPITIEDLKAFPNLIQIYGLKNLSYDDFKKMLQYFPDLLHADCELIDDKIDSRIVASYTKNNYIIGIGSNKYHIDKNNPLLGSLDDTKKVPKIKINDDILKHPEYIEELPKYVQEIDVIEFYSTDFDDIITIINKLKSKNIKINTIHIKCENKTYPRFNALKSACEGCETKVNYFPHGDVYCNLEFKEKESCTLDEFITLRATIDYYLDLIKSNDLSPFEQMIFVYDIIKSFKYEDDKSNSNNSRRLHNIVKTGKIVCLGYAIFVAQLLKELGINAAECGVRCSLSDQEDYHNTHPEEIEQNHSRTLVKLDDNKYNIHGVFCSDPTYDSSPEESLNLYNFFLLHYNEYIETFPRDTLPELFYFYWHNIQQTPYLLDEYFILKNFYLNGEQMLNELFEKIPNSKLISEYLDCESISVEKFTNALRVVRKCEGYPEDSIEEEVNKANYHFKRIFSDTNQMNK